MPGEDAAFDEFIENQVHVRAVLNRRGVDGKCAALGTLETESAISPDELDMHIKFLKLDLYVDEAASDLFCTRDAVRVAGARMETGTK